MSGLAKMIWDFGKNQSPRLDLEPVNIPFENVVDLVKRSQPVFVALEPGDMTRYMFYILPLWNGNLTPTGTGWSLAQLQQCIQLVSMKPDNYGGYSITVPLEDPVQMWHSGIAEGSNQIGNGHTRMVLAWFCYHLGVALGFMEPPVSGVEAPHGN